MAGLSISAKSHTRLKVSITIAILLIIGLAATAGYFWYRWFSTGEKPPIASNLVTVISDDKDSPSGDNKLQEVTGKTDPKYLTIPDVSAQSVEVYEFHLGNDNTVDLSGFGSNAGWLSQSGFPGQGFGRVVIAINPIDAPTDGPSLTKIDRLVIGDPIALTSLDNKVYNYTVSEIKQVSVGDFYSSELGKLINPGSDVEGESLGVIIASGKWIPKNKQYSSYTLVTATADSKK